MSGVGSMGLLGVVLSGVRLRCPACGDGPISEGRRLKEACSSCGWRFFRLGDGDWLVTWLIAYTLASVTMLVAWPLLHFTVSLPLAVELAVLGALAAAVVAALFPYCQGASAAILYFLRVRWKE